MNDVIARGDLSHVASLHQSAQRAPARYAINATFCAFDTPDGPRWLFEDVHDGGPLTRKGEDQKWQPDQLACIDRLPATRLDTLKMAVRFLVLHRDRSIRLVTEGLGAKPFHGRVVMLVNEHTLSAGEMVAAFAKENWLARIVGTRTGAKCWAAQISLLAMGLSFGSPPPGGTPGAALSSRGVVCSPTSMCRCRSMRFGMGTTISSKLQPPKCRPCPETPPSPYDSRFCLRHSAHRLGSFRDPSATFGRDLPSSPSRRTRRI